MSNLDYGKIWDREVEKNGLRLVHSEIGGGNETQYKPKTAIEGIGWSALKLAKCNIPSLLWGYARVLEIGCGPGFNLASLAGMCGNLYGVDPSEKMISYGKENVVKHLSNVTLIHSRIQDYKPGILFDAIFEIIVFQHLRKPEVQEIINAAHDLLSPDGRFVFQFLKATSPRVRMFDGPEAMRPVPCMRGYEPDEVDDMLREADLSVVHTWDIDENWFVVEGMRA